MDAFTPGGGGLDDTRCSRIGLGPKILLFLSFYLQLNTAVMGVKTRTFLWDFCLFTNLNKPLGLKRVLDCTPERFTRSSERIQCSLDMEYSDASSALRCVPESSRMGFRNVCFITP